MFAEAAYNWDLEKLYKVLGDVKRQVSPRSRKGLTGTEKLYLRGLLCGYSPAEMARKLTQSPKGVEVYMSKTLYQYFKSLVDLPSNEQVGNWRNVQTWLEEAGYIAVFSRMRGNRILERLTAQDCNTPHSCDYRYKTRSFAENRFKTSLPVDQLVKIVNISFNQHIGTIDINIQVTIPKEIELKSENTKE